jgi:hypothetical protein
VVDEVDGDRVGVQFREAAQSTARQYARRPDCRSRAGTRSVSQFERRCGPYPDPCVADADGVTVIPASRVTEVAEAARRRAADEQLTMTRLQEGHTTLELFGWQ